MVTALRLMPNKPDPEPADVETFAVLRGRYQAVVHERDTLRARLDRFETLEKATLHCDGTKCKTSVTLIGPAPVETALIGHAISERWTLVGTKHFCPGCSR